MNAELPNIVLGSRGGTVDSRIVLDEICRVHDVTFEKLVGRERHADLITIRFLAYYLLRYCCGMTFEQIGLQMAHDHGAVYHGIKTLKERMSINPTLRSSVTQWRDKFSKTPA